MVLEKNDEDSMTNEELLDKIGMKKNCCCMPSEGNRVSMSISYEEKEG